MDFRLLDADQKAYVFAEYVRRVGPWYSAADGAIIGLFWN
jgi:hypothetical protein